MSAYLKELTKPTDPFYLRLIKGSNVTMPEFSNRGVFYTGTSGFGGVVTSNTTNPLIDVRDYIYTAGTTSNLDFFGYTIDIPTGVRGTDVSFEFNYKTSVSNFVVSAYGICTSGNKSLDLSTSLDIGTKQYRRVFTVPSDCTTIKFGWQYTGNTSGETLEFDNIIFKFYSPEMGQTTITEAVQYKNYTSGTTGGIKFTAKEEGLSDNSKVISDDNSGSYTKFTFIQNSKGTATLNWNSSATTTTFYVRHYNSAGTLLKEVSSGRTSVINSNVPYTFKASAGDYILAAASDIPTTPLNFSITCTAIRDNVVTTYSEDSVGEILYSINSTPKNGFISAQGSIIGNTSGTHQGSTYYNLYKYAWTYAVTTAGEPFVISSAKGASYDADWAAGKTIKIDYSGLFPRVSGGNAGDVGAKQMDAFQGHYHSTSATYPSNFHAEPTTIGGSGHWAFDSAYVLNGTLGPTTDGTSGTPRTASETRPINSALYAYIRYAVSQPTLLALPTSKENVFSARISSSGSITSKSSDWINSVSLSDTSLFTIDISKLGLTTAPEASVSIRTANDNTTQPRGAYVYSTTPTTVVIRTFYHQPSPHTITWIAESFDITIQKQSPDYTAPGVFVGNVAKNQIATLYANPATVASVAAGFVDLTWDGVLGDSSIVSMTAGSAIFTLQAGEYLIESEGIAYRTDSAYHNLYNNTTAASIEDSSVVSSAPAADSILKSGGKFSKLAISTSTSFKIRQFSISANAAGFGSAGFAGKRAKLQITKLNGQ